MIISCTLWSDMCVLLTYCLFIPMSPSCLSDSQPSIRGRRRDKRTEQKHRREEKQAAFCRSVVRQLQSFSIEIRSRCCTSPPHSQAPALASALRSLPFTHLFDISHCVSLILYINSILGTLCMASPSTSSHAFCLSHSRTRPFSLTHTPCLTRAHALTHSRTRPIGYCHCERICTAQLFSLVRVFSYMCLL